VRDAREIEDDARLIVLHLLVNSLVEALAFHTRVDASGELKQLDPRLDLFLVKFHESIPARDLRTGIAG
jgi:hypothetical protein